MYTDAEVRELVLGAVASLGDPVQVVFRNHRCADCGDTGDARLMGPLCHMQPVYVHPGRIVHYHPGTK